MAGHLLSTMDRLAEGDQQRREEAQAKAGAEVLDDLTMPDDDDPREEATSGGLPEGAEQLDDIEPALLVLPEIGTPVRYHARRGFMRRRQTEFPAFVLSHRPEEGTVDLFVMLDSDDTIVEERVLPFADEEPYHCFAILGGGHAPQEQIEMLWAELRLIRSQIFGEYVDPPKALMDYLVDFEAKLNALGASQPKKARANKD